MNYLANAALSTADSRDYWFSPIVTGNPPPEEVDQMPDVVAVLDQGAIGSCVAHGIVEEVDSIKKANGIIEQSSPLLTYYDARDKEGRIGQEGCSLRNGLASARKTGVALLTDYPYDISMVDQRPPQSVYDAAALRKIERYETLYYRPWHGSEYLDLFMRCLAEGLSIITVMPVTREYTKLAGPWQQHDFANYARGEFIGYHCQKLIGYDRRCQRGLMQGSWGPNVGDGGFMGIPFKYFDDIVEARIVRTFAGSGHLRLPGIYCTRNDKTGVSAQIVPTPDEDGKPTKIWIGGKWNGQPYKWGKGGWTPWDYAPVMEVVFDCALDLDIGDGDFCSLAGAEIFVGHGADPFVWKTSKVCTL